jgi:D-galactarolactone cycloisomerase
MEITDVRAVPLSDPVPEGKRHRTDLGTKVKTDATLVVVETDTEHTGVGAALGHPPTIESIVEGSLAPALVGEDPTYTGRLWEKLYNGSRAEPSLERGYSQPRWDRRGYTLEAISGVDIALWDVTGKAFGQPVYKLLGAVRDDVRAYASGGWATGEGTAEELGGYVDRGFDAVKMRAVGHESFSVENTLERVEIARDGIGYDVDLMVDAHGSLDVPTATKLARRLEEYEIAWFEEPVSPDDHPGLAEVRSATEIPVAAGESEFTRFDFRSLLDCGALDVAQPDVARCGGITESRRVAAMASARNVKVAPHAWGSGALFAASVHLTVSTPNCHVLEVPQAYMPLLTDLYEEEFDVQNGRVSAPDRPGLGFTVREDVEERFEYVEGPEYEF